MAPDENPLKPGQPVPMQPHRPPPTPDSNRGNPGPIPSTPPGSAPFPRG